MDHLSRLVCTAGISLAMAATAAAEPIVIQPGPADGTDVWITSYYSYNDDYGVDDERLQVGGWADYYHTLIRFDVSSAPEYAAAATIVLQPFPAGGQSTPVSMKLYRVLSNWDESTGWPTRPIAEPVGCLPAPVPGSPYTIDVTSLYNDWKAGRRANFGIELRPDDVSNRFNMFRSSDYALDPEQRPKLVITPGTPLGGRPAGVSVVSEDPDLTIPGPIVSDGTQIFVANGSTILTIPISGGSATRLYSDPSIFPICPSGLTRIGNALFAIDPDGDPDATAIFRAQTTGSNSVSKIYSGFASGQPIVDGVGITTDGSRLFTSDEVQGRIFRLNNNGSSITPITSRYGGFIAGSHFNSVSYSSGDLFVVDDGTEPTYSQAGIFRIESAVGQATPVHVGPPFVRPVAVAVSATEIFVADPGARSIWHMPRSGGAPQTLIHWDLFEQIVPNGMVLDGESLFVATAGDHGRIFRVSTTPVPACGDANGSGTITASDALSVLRAAVGGQECDELACVCDVNGNGSISAGDALAVLKLAVGSTSETNCQC